MDDFIGTYPGTDLNKRSEKRTKGLSLLTSSTLIETTTELSLWVPGHLSASAVIEMDGQDLSLMNGLSDRRWGDLPCSPSDDR